MALEQPQQQFYQGIVHPTLKPEGGGLTHLPVEARKLALRPNYAVVTVEFYEFFVHSGS